MGERGWVQEARPRGVRRRSVSGVCVSGRWGFVLEYFVGVNEIDSLVRLVVRDSEEGESQMIPPFEPKPHSPPKTPFLKQLVKETISSQNKRHLPHPSNGRILLFSRREREPPKPHSTNSLLSNPTSSHSMATYPHERSTGPSSDRHARSRARGFGRAGETGPRREEAASSREEDRRSLWGPGEVEDCEWEYFWSEKRWRRCGLLSFASGGVLTGFVLVVVRR